MPSFAATASNRAARSLQAAPQGFSVVCLSPQPWEVSLPTNRQQIMRRLAERGHEVLFVHTGGFLGRDLLRRRESRPALPPPWRLRRHRAPNLAPWGHRHRLPQRLNNRLGARSVARAAASLRRPLVAWVYDPCAAGMASRLEADLLVYDCVDDYAEQAGSDAHRRALVAHSERALLSRADLVFATARALFERHREANPHTFLVRNVGDVSHFARPELDVPEELRLLRAPVIGFVGNFLANKVDTDLVRVAARLRPEWSFALVGPPADAKERLLRLAEEANVHWLGLRPYEELPRYVAGFDVAVIPYLANDYTRSCFPLKTFEYLAAGKPVVATGLPELEGMEPDVVVAADAAGFVAAVEGALAIRDAADVERRRALAAANSWETRTQRLEELVEAALSAAPRSYQYAPRKFGRLSGETPPGSGHNLRTRTTRP
jgi:glycosyltransferase involved in cell wall biosynthesis